MSGNRVTVALASLLLALPVTGVSAQPIAITNPSFEADVLPDNGFLFTATGWVTTPFAGAYNPAVSAYPGGAPDGQNVVFSSGGSLTQTLGPALLANTTYTLGYFVGQRGDGLGFSSYLVELLAGGTTLASDGSLVPPPGTFLPGAVVFTTTGAHAQLGQALGIRLSASGDQPSFDNISLVASLGTQPPNGTVVPEPGTVALLSAGLLVLAITARRRGTRVHG